MNAAGECRAPPCRRAGARVDGRRAAGRRAGTGLDPQQRIVVVDDQTSSCRIDRARRYRARATATGEFPKRRPWRTTPTSSRNCSASRRPNGAATPVKPPSRPNRRRPGTGMTVIFGSDRPVRRAPLPARSIERRDAEPFAVDPQRDALASVTHNAMSARSPTIDSGPPPSTRQPNFAGRQRSSGRARPSATASARTSGPASGPTMMLRAASVQVGSSRPSRSSASCKRRRAFLAQAADLQIGAARQVDMAVAQASPRCRPGPPPARA